MGACRDCRFWSQSAGMLAGRVAPGDMLGICRRTITRPERDVKAGALAFAIGVETLDAETWGSALAPYGVLVTRPEFGCVQFAPTEVR